MLKPQQPPIYSDSLKEDKLLFIHGLPPTAGAAEIRQFFKKPKVPTISQIVFSLKPGRAMLEFDGHPGKAHLENQPEQNIQKYTNCQT